MPVAAVERHLHRILLQVFRGLYSGKCVDIHNAVDTIIVILQSNIVLDGSQIIPQVLAARGTGA
jgi:hypothetical protein